MELLAAPTARTSRAYVWLTGSRHDETPEVREALALTLAEPRVLACFSFVWTQLLAWTVFAMTSSPLALAWGLLDAAVFSVRLTLSFRHDAALRAGRRPPREAMVAIELVGFSLVLVGAGASFSLGDPVLSLLLAFVAMGIFGYVTARLAAFPRMAILVLCVDALATGVGLAFSPIDGVWMLAVLTPGFALGFAMLTAHNHQILVGSLRAQQENRRLSLHDPLTGLANRLHLYESLEAHRALAATDDRHRLAVLCLDLDGFKNVNDAHGHPAGDLLLTTVASRLQNLAGPGTVVARLGGDEFVILAPGLDRSDAMVLADRVVEAVRRPYDLGDATATVSASLGISLGPDHGVDPQGLLDLADRALYAVKRSGKGRWLLHDEPGHLTSLVA